MRLGDTPDAIAETLRRLNIRGHPSLTCSCPLAMILLEKFPGRRVRVGTITASVDGVTCDLPDACSRFVYAFDRGRYEFLFAPIGG